MSSPDLPLSHDSILEAASRLSSHVKRTPVIESDPLSERLGRRVHLKLENLQRSGSFKIRGATNAILHERDRAREHGVITASAGNHAQGVAYGARIVDCDALVIMPENTPENKILATRKLGATVRLAGSNYPAAYERATELQQSTDRLFIHPYDQASVIEGQGSCGVEMTDQIEPPLNWLMVPVGGGGLAAGVALWMAETSPETRIIPVQSKQGSSLRAALEAGEPTSIDPPRTVAEGLATSRIGDLPFNILREHASDPVLISENTFVRAILHTAEEECLVGEGAGVAGIAAVLEHGKKVPEGPGAIILTGGNLDVLELSQLIDRGLHAAGRLVRVQTQLPDQPGALAELSRVIGEEEGNIQVIHHERSDRGLSARSARLEIELSVRDPEHRRRLLKRLEDEGYPVRRI